MQSRVQLPAQPRGPLVFLAKGSRGDVQPLAVLAHSYSQAHPDTRCVLATHHHHLDTISSLYGATLELVAIDKADSFEKQKRVDRAKDDRTWRMEEMVGSWNACKGAGGIVFNLFAIEGHAIAEVLHVPCVAVSPFAVTTPPPDGFTDQLQEIYPDLVAILRTATPETVSYAEVGHWMWRLFLDDLGDFREDVLGLNAIPFEDSEGHPISLPPPTPLLYGISPLLLLRGPHLPASVHVTGFWLANVPKNCSQQYPSLHHFLSSGDPPIYCGFGSMPSLGHDINYSQLINLITKAWVETGLRAIVQVPNTHLFDLPSHPKVHILTSDVPHGWLLPLCTIALHHGGAGTVAACLSAGVPQLITPFMFDQREWAERLAWAGVGLRLPPIQELTKEVLTCGLKKMASKETKDTARDLAAKLAQEDGVGRAVALIHETVG